MATNPHLTLALTWARGFVHLWWPHIVVWLLGVLYFYAQREKPKPRLWFDIPWRLLVVASGMRILGEGIRVHWFPFPWEVVFLWASGVFLFSYGEGIHWGGNDLNDHLIPSLTQGQRKNIPFRLMERIRWLDEIVGHILPTIGIVIFLLAQLLATRLWLLPR